MKMIDQIRHLIYIAPVRCGRSFYQCELKETANRITVSFVPTDKFTKIDPRRDNESSIPEHINRFEEWQHTGMVIGSIEYFCKENNIDCLLSGFTLSIDNVDVDYNVDKYEILRHSQRSFNVDTPVDRKTIGIINDLIDKFDQIDNGYKIMITDSKVRDVIYSLAIYWEGEGKPGNIHIPQMNAPLLITVPPKEFDLQYYFDMGRLYSTIGLAALDQGYQLAFCNSFNYFNDRVTEIQDVLHLNYGVYTLDTLVPRPFICIGKALDPNKPHNWVAEHDMIMPTCIHLSEDFITVS
jgi:hypothetical protein